MASGASKEEVAAVKPQPLPTNPDKTGSGPSLPPGVSYSPTVTTPVTEGTGGGGSTAATFGSGERPAWSGPRGQPNDGGYPRRDYPPRGGPTHGGENRFIGACYICEEIGLRAVQYPTRECYACRQVGHIAPECPSRQRSDPNETPNCQVCGQKGATFQTCGPCAPRRAQWGNGTVGGQNNPLTPHPTSQGH